MANEKRCIDANETINAFTNWLTSRYDGRMPRDVVAEIPTVDAVPVDEIRVDIMSLSLENQEAVLNVSICGKPNEVKIPFSKEVAEVVHGHNTYDHDSAFECSVCGWSDWDTMTGDGKYNYCPNCGAKMDGYGK